MKDCNCGKGSVGMCTPSSDLNIGMCVPSAPLNDSYNYNNLRNQPKINGVTLKGELTSIDLKLYGENNPETFVFEQKTPLDKWTIKHPLNKYPSCTVVDSAGTQVMGEVTYLDKENLIVQFSAAFSGICYLN